MESLIADCFRCKTNERVILSVEGGLVKVECTRCNLFVKDENEKLALKRWEKLNSIQIDHGEKPKIKLGDSLDEAKKIICGERQDQYGSPEDSFTDIAILWNAYLVSHDIKNKGALLVPSNVADMMILLKIARDKQQKNRDNCLDIIGYAAIKADKLNPMEQG